MIVYGVYEHRDQTEGRGGMSLSKIFITRDLAEMFANSRRGVMGKNPFQDHAAMRALFGSRPGNKTRWIDPECRGWFCKDCYPTYSDVQVRELEVLTELPA